MKNRCLVLSGAWTALACLVLQSAVCSADLLVSSFFSDQVLRYGDQTGTSLGTFTIGGAIDEPYGLAFAPNRDLFVASLLTDAVLQYDRSGEFKAVFASVVRPAGPTFGPDGDLFVAHSTNEIGCCDGATGQFKGIFASGGGLDVVNDLKFGPNGDLFVVSVDTNQILRFDGSSGAFKEVFAQGLNYPWSLAFNPAGDLFVSSYFYDSVLQFDGMTGAFKLTFATCEEPKGIAFGADGDLFVASIGYDQILGFDGSTGAPKGVFAEGELLNGPTYSAFSEVPEPSTTALVALRATIGLLTRSGARKAFAPAPRGSSDDGRRKG